ncbi:MAG: hypothetical protein M0R40_02280 [Firmicutes bacterium]|nr:hypothetical protein [Bacillota bacterium]
MRKEQIKSVVLVLLILNCVQLTGQIWFNKKLWPGGYNFFAFNFSSTAMNAVKPQRLVINGGNAREVYYPRQKQYNDIYKNVTNIIANFIDSDDLRGTAAVKDDWKTFLKDKSILLSYGHSMDSGSFTSSFNKAVTGFPYVGVLSDVLITGDGVTNETIVCIFNSITETAVTYRLEGGGESFLKYIESATFGKNHNKSFAFELFWDLNRENTSIERSVLVDSFVLLPMDNESVNLITAENPLENDFTIFDGIVSALGYTPSTLRKSVSENDNVASYVENSATIKISPSGMIEYSAVDPQRGIPLQTGKADSLNVVNKVFEITEGIYRQIGIDDIPNIYISSDLIAQKGERFILKMNYSHNGKPIFVYSKDNLAPVDAIHAEVEGGYLKSFKMFIRTFNEIDDVATTVPVITAFDELAKQIGKTRKVLIEDVFKCYIIKDSLAEIAWGVKTDDVNDNIIIINFDD